MEIHGYCLVIIIAGIAFFGSAIMALCWAVKQGHFKNFEQTARSIFNDEEPIGIQTDGFPGKINLPITPQDTCFENGYISKVFQGSSRRTSGEAEGRRRNPLFNSLGQEDCKEPRSTEAERTHIREALSTGVTQQSSVQVELNRGVGAYKQYVTEPNPEVRERGTLKD